MNYEALGERIRTQRKMKKMTQEELAAATDISVSYIGHIERGLKHCSLDTLVAIANTLDLTPDILLQDSLKQGLVEGSRGLSDLSRSMLNEISNVLREYDSGLRGT